MAVAFERSSVRLRRSCGDRACDAGRSASDSEIDKNPLSSAGIPISSEVASAGSREDKGATPAMQDIGSSAFPPSLLNRNYDPTGSGIRNLLQGNILGSKRILIRHMMDVGKSVAALLDAITLHVIEGIARRG